MYDNQANDPKRAGFGENQMTDERIPTDTRQTRRGGAALIIVLAMTGMLMFLGFFFFSYVSAERNSAAWFALSANRQVSESDYFDFALQQVLIGPTDDLKNSALYGRKWSMIPNMLGSFGPDLKPQDLHPYTGKGIHVRYQGDNAGDGMPTDSNPMNLGFNFDYLGDDTRLGKILNFSPAANPVTTAGNVPFSPLGQQRHPEFIPDFSPDAGYTYPDINSMFLGYFTLVDVNPNPDVVELRRVWIPSFHRPQYLPRQATPDLYVNDNYRNRVLRPHQNSRVQLRRWNGSEVEVINARRYVGVGGFNTDFTSASSGPNFGFPFDAPNAGIWQNPMADEINYEGVDADGIRANGNEAIILDLDHRPEVLADGTRRIPMFYITIMDGDGLLNLNAAGNLFGEEQTLVHARTGASSGLDPAAYGNGRFITKSNLGLSPGELNMGRALYRPLPAAAGGSTTRTAPSTSMQYNNMFAYDPMSAQVTQVDMANMELTRLLVGVADGNPLTTTERVAGRWGEVGRLEQAVAGQMPPMPPFPRTSWSAPFFPMPGRTNRDDNFNFVTGGVKARIPGTESADPVFGPLGIPIPPGVHPVDPHGVAIDYLGSPEFSNAFATAVANEAFVPNETLFTQLAANNTFGKLRMSRQPGVAMNDPSRWPAYSSRWELQLLPGQVVDIELFTGVRPWYRGTQTLGSLQATQSNGTLNRFLADEPDEVVIEPALRDYTYDALFSVGEMSFLHMGNADWGSGTNSRLQDLLEYNFQRLEPTDNWGNMTNFNDSWWLRSQFTTDSFDRWEFSFAPAVGSQPGVPGTPRGWEFNPVQGDQTRLLFPPSFGNVPRFSPNDPLRPEVRQWLTIELNRREDFRNFPLPQRRLNINRFLDRTPNGQFVERHLTPHPVFEDVDAGQDGGILDMMYAPGTSVVQIHDPVPPAVAFANMQGNKFVQEWWAKYDRQRMARDIYVLLYTLGGSHDFNPTDPGDPQLGTPEHLERCREMAQFAVNYVDALDRDSVVTEFIYDTNLADGWSITGEKDANGDLVERTELGGQAARVFGVEAQQLTFSETLWTAFDREADMDIAETPWTEGNGEPPIQFLFMELRNASPFPARFGDGTWRLRRIVGEDDFLEAETDDITATFRQNMAITEIPEGANFWVGTHDVDDDQLPAAIMIDLDGDSNYQASEIFCPSRQPQDSSNPGPICHLDLCHVNHNGYFNRDGHSEAGYFLSEQPEPIASGAEIRLVLERRLNQHGSGALDNDRANPWVPVDYMVARFTANGALVVHEDEDLKETAQILQELETALSLERPQPFSPNVAEHQIEMNGRSHTFGPAEPLPFNDPIYQPYVEANSNTIEINGVPTFTLWQPHFDRDFTSVYELLSLPLTGPNLLTQRLAETGSLNGRQTALTRFRIPDLGEGPPAIRFSNWYRVLELLEVPTSVQAHLRDELPIPRTPAKINLNTIRHPGVLAAMIDDDFHLNNFRAPVQILSDPPAVRMAYPFLQLRDRVEANRHWYQQFVFSRDRIDPHTGVPLPGIPGSRPFRPLSYTNVTGTQDGRASIEHTLLRTMPYNGGAGPMGENSTPNGSYGSGWIPASRDDALDTAMVRRGLFEARTEQDIGNDAVDYHTRNRLLNKIANNSTVRSHVFYCWIEVRFHEAAEDEFGNAQVGGPLDTTAHPPKRAFFVLDRSKLEEAWDPRTRSFDWRKFVTFRKVLQ